MLHRLRLKLLRGSEKQSSRSYWEAIVGKEQLLWKWKEQSVPCPPIASTTGPSVSLEKLVKVQLGWNFGLSF